MTTPPQVFYATTMIGNRADILAELQKKFPLQEQSDDLKDSRYFWSDTSFSEQIDNLLTFNKYKRSQFVYGLIYFYENMPESELTDALLQTPRKIREFRVQRVEIHR